MKPTHEQGRVEFHVFFPNHDDNRSVLRGFNVLCLWTYSTGIAERRNKISAHPFSSLQRLEQIGGAILALGLQTCPCCPLVVVPPARVRTVEFDLHIVLEAPAVGALDLGVHARAQGVQPGEQQSLSGLAFGLGGSGASSQTQGAALLERQILHVAGDAREHGEARGARDQVLGVAGGAVALLEQIMALFADLNKENQFVKVEFRGFLSMRCLGW